MKLNFTQFDSDRANDEWGANCGPHALAAALWLDLSTVRDLMPEFEARRYTNPTMMESALDRAGINYQRKTRMYTSALAEGISRLQWEGPWLERGVPFAAAYAKTHWVAHSGGMVFCTCMRERKWMRLDEWRMHIGRFCREEIRDCDGWHATHHYTFEVLAKEVRA